MGWRERDWAKFTDDERAALFGGGRRSLPPSAEGADFRVAPMIPRRRTSVSGKWRKIGNTTLTSLGIGVVAAIVVAYLHAHHSNVLRSPSIVNVQPPPSNVVVQPPTNVIAIRWRASDLAPAPQAGHVCVTATSHGQICASYVVGERPADTLTRQIEAMGLQVESTGSG